MQANWHRWMLLLLAAAAALAVGWMLLLDAASSDVWLITEKGGVRALLPLHAPSEMQTLCNEDPGQICINTADASQLQMLPGISRTLAESIVAYRKQNGRFLSVEQLLDIPGMGQTTYEKIWKSIRLEE